MGRLTLPLADMGLVMTGVDLTAAYIRRARRLARAAGVRARFLRRDMREIDFDGEFHAAFNWFTSIGYFSEADDLTFCRRVFRALRPGGRFLVECLNISFILSHFRGRDERTIGKVRITTRNRWNSRTRRMRSIWTLRKGDAVETHPIDLRCYTGTEMRKLLGAAGFRNIELHGNPPLRRFTRHSRRLIAVATRPKS
jgi:SAM-dependent methyltransferase